VSEFIKKNHLGDLKTLLRIYNAKGDLYKGKFLWISIAIDILLTVDLGLSRSDIYGAISKIIESYIAILPCLLGFNLGAYALLIGFGTSSFLGRISKNFDKKVTLFQRASSVFGFCVLLQAVALIFVFVTKQIIAIQESTGSDLLASILPDNAIAMINGSAYFIINLLGIYSITILVKVIENIFSLSQLSHFYSGLEQAKVEPTKDVDQA
jgi:hypothetical protein